MEKSFEKHDKVEVEPVDSDVSCCCST